jgi:ankyrin repeat protein
LTKVATWIDPKTGLEWALHDNGSDVDWDQAAGYCRNLQLDSHTDWRLPTFEELASIYDRTQTAENTYHVKGGISLTGGSWSRSGDGSAAGMHKFFILWSRPSFASAQDDNSMFRALCMRSPLTESSIGEAAGRGDLAKVQALLKDNANLVSSRNENGVTPLLLALQEGHMEVAKLLLAKGAEINAKDSDDDDKTPLHWAAQHDHIDVAKLLLANHADVNAKDVGGYTPLLWAAQKNYLDMAGLLLAGGAEVNAKANDGMTALHLAAIFGYKDLAILLLANKAEVNAMADQGITPLHIAAIRGRTDLVELLRQHGGHE